MKILTVQLFFLILAISRSKCTFNDGYKIYRVNFEVGQAEQLRTIVESIAGTEFWLFSLGNQIADIFTSPDVENKLLDQLDRHGYTYSLSTDDIKSTEGTGITLKKKVPDTITSWVVTGVSLNPNTGLALTQKPRKLNVFQPFYVTTNLPYSVKRGEVISISVIVFNNMDKNLDAKVTLDNSDNEFELTEATNEVTESASEDTERTKTLSILANSGKSVSFMIRLKKVGLVNLRISVVSLFGGYTIHQTLKVDPEGDL